MKRESKKRLVIIHGWGGSPVGDWFPWLASEMKARGWQVVVPAMPNTNNPKLAEWRPLLKQMAGKVDKNTFMVGHSVGCITILRFLESLSEAESIGGAILVAGFADPLKDKELKNFFQEPIDWKQIKTRCRKFVTIHSTDDPFVPIENSLKLEGQLGAKAIKLEGWRHFSGDDGIFSLPIVRQELLKISE
jgi:hypothetical protein